MNRPTIKRERLRRAVALLGAVQVSPRRWAQYDNGTCRWHVVTEAAVASLCDYLDDQDPQVSGDAYSHWCARTEAREMPAGWCPEAFNPTPHP